MLNANRFKTESKTSTRLSANSAATESESPRDIAKSLYSRLELDFTEHKEWTLVEYVRHAKKETEKRKSAR